MAATLSKQGHSLEIQTQESTPSSDIFIQQASDLNVEGVFFLASSQLNKALDSFNNALSVMRLGACEQQSNHSPHSQTKTAERSPSELASLSYHYTPVEIESLSDEKFFLYNRALIFDHVENPDSHYSPLDISFYGTLILFNIALCKHMQSKVAFGNKRYALSNQAVAMYALCSQFMKRFRFHTKDTLLLLAGALNNEAQIQLEFAEYKQARQILDQLTKVIAVASKPLTGGAHSTNTRDDSNLVENFALNIFSARLFTFFAPSA